LQNIELFVHVHCDINPKCLINAGISADFLDQHDKINSIEEISSGITSKLAVIENPPKDPYETDINDVYLQKNPNEKSKIIEILRNIHLNKHNSKDFTKKFPLKMLEMDISLKKIFGFSSDYQKLENYDYVRGNINEQDPQFNIKMFIGPDKDAAILSDKTTVSCRYIPTDNISNNINFKNPIITGEILLPELRDPFHFITNLVPLDELKQEEPSLINKALKIEYCITTPFEEDKHMIEKIDIGKIQRYIQGTSRVAILDKISELDKN